MMEALGQWILSITGTILLISVAECLMPSGAVKQVGKLVCGLILLLMLVKPGISLSAEDWLAMSDSWDRAYQVEDMENYYNNQMKSIIEQQVSTYIVDKAMEQGVSCTAEVHCVLDEKGEFRPILVKFSYLSEEQRSVCRRIVAEDLGLVDNGIEFKEVQEDEMEIASNQ